MIKKVAIIQSNYIPWKGYFDMINMVDEFVFHDDLQYTKDDWRNRNQIKTNNGIRWLTIPCGRNEKRLICEVELMDDSWQKQHWRILSNSYNKAPYFHYYKHFFEEIYLGKKWIKLSDFNQYMINRICKDLLGIKTIILDSRSFNLTEKKSNRVLELLLKLKAEYYLSGPSAKQYLIMDSFNNHGINVHWMDYNGYSPYPQLHPPFRHDVSIVDLLFNVGPDFGKYMKSDF
jgi:hypothetical protein